MPLVPLAVGKVICLTLRIQALVIMIFLILWIAVVHPFHYLWEIRIPLVPVAIILAILVRFVALCFQRDEPQ